MQICGHSPYNGVHYPQNPMSDNYQFLPEKLWQLPLSKNGRRYCAIIMKCLNKLARTCYYSLPKAHRNLWPFTLKLCSYSGPRQISSSPWTRDPILLSTNLIWVYFLSPTEKSGTMWWPRSCSLSFVCLFVCHCLQPWITLEPVFGFWWKLAHCVFRVHYPIIFNNIRIILLPFAYIFFL